MQLITTDNLSIDQWRELRRWKIGGSDAAAIAGQNRYRTAYQAALMISGQIPSILTNEAMHIGKVVEPVVIGEYQREEGCDLVKSVFVQDAETEFMIANLDAVRTDGFVRPIEAKVVGTRSAHRWGSENSGEIPDEYVMQGQHYNKVLSSPFVDVRAKFLNIDYGDLLEMLEEDGVEEFERYVLSCPTKKFKIMRDEEVIHYLVEIENDFMTKLRRGEMPEIDGSRETKKFLNSRYSGDDGKVIECPPEFIGYVNALKEIRLNNAAGKEQEAIYKNKLLSFMVENGASTLLVPDGQITNKAVKGSVSINYKELVESLRLAPELLDQFTVRKQGGRRFSVPRNWGRE